jgi:hypothetical protein
MKSTNAEVQKRVEEVLQIRLLGAEFHDIQQHAAAQGWNVKDRQLWTYIHKSDELLAQTLETNREKLLNRHIAQRRALYARAMQVSDYRTALAVLKDDAELLGLYRTGGKDGPKEDAYGGELTDAERATALAALCDRLRARATGPAAEAGAGAAGVGP